MLVIRCVHVRGHGFSGGQFLGLKQGVEAVHDADVTL